MHLYIALTNHSLIMHDSCAHTPTRMSSS